LIEVKYRKSGAKQYTSAMPVNLLLVAKHDIPCTIREAFIRKSLPLLDWWKNALTTCSERQSGRAAERQSGRAAERQSGVRRGSTLRVYSIRKSQSKIKVMLF
jgi:hypothetical protein